MIAGAIWIGFVGVLRHYRGVNETISSLLLFYIAVSVLNFFVEGMLRDPSDPEQAVNHADRPGEHGWATFPAPTSTGASSRASLPAACSTS